MKGEALMAKAEKAVVSARLLVEHGDNDGACNRAYYAMFDAARAALLAVQAPVEAEVARTHGGLISAFSLHLVKSGRVAVEVGRALNRVQEIRLVADYRGDSVSGEQALWTVEQGETFVAIIRDEFGNCW